MEKNIGSYDQMLQLTAMSVMSGTPVASAVIMQPNWVMSLIRQNMVFPISDLTMVDTSKTEPVNWNQLVREDFTFNGKTYAFATGYGNSKHSVFIFYNKRLFEEAGIDPELPYDMQKAGTWTWDAYMDICKKLTRDIDNDGVVDTYALTTQHSTTIDAILFSNGAEWVGKDKATGKFFNATTKPEFIQSIQWAYQLHTEGVIMPQPEGSNWDWYKEAFRTGKGAMMVDQEYCADDLKNMTDDWGIVLFPKGPRMDEYRYATDENVWVIPATYSREEAEKILYGYYLWNYPVEGEAPDAWKSERYPEYRDTRAVDETLVLAHDPKYGKTNNAMFVPDLERGDIAWNLWWDGVDPAQLVESVQQVWDAAINDVNPK
jgi:ABC-type glycerol-3-phosphate transport system substrate-binding protein